MLSVYNFALLNMQNITDIPFKIKQHYLFFYLVLKIVFLNFDCSVHDLFDLFT